jgi:BASS family bile acid:Na+ symporter
MAVRAEAVLAEGQGLKTPCSSIGKAFQEDRVMTAVQVIIVLLVLSVGALVASVGMQSTLSELLSLFRQPIRLLKAVVAVNVVVPLAAAVMLALFPMTRDVRIAIMVMAVSPAPPLIARRELKAVADRDYALGLYAALALLSIVIVPLTVAIVSRAYGVSVELAPFAVGKKVIVLLILPLLLGLGFRRLAPSRAERLSPIVGKVALALLAVGVVPLVGAFWPRILSLIGNGTMLAMALVVAVALTAGHLLGGPDLNNRGALALVACARHPGVALTIANAAGADKRVGAAIVLFLLVGLVVSMPYQLWVQRRVAGSAGGAPPGIVAH